MDARPEGFFVTRIPPGHPVIRETAAQERRRPLVVALHPRHLEIRPKGLRAAFAVDYETIYDLARKLVWRRAQAQKRKRAARG